MPVRECAPLCPTRTLAEEGSKRLGVDHALGLNVATGGHSGQARPRGILLMSKLTSGDHPPSRWTRTSVVGVDWILERSTPVREQTPREVGEERLMTC